MLELSAAKKERDFYLSKVDQSETISKIGERLKKVIFTIITRVKCLFIVYRGIVMSLELILDRHITKV